MENENKLFLKVNSQSFCYEDGYDSDDGYYYWQKNIETSYLNVEETDMKNAMFSLPKSKKYYLVYETYSYGDTFGSCDGNTLEIELFTNEEEAKKFLSILENFYNLYHQSYYGKTKKEQEKMKMDYKEFLDQNVEKHLEDSLVYKGKTYNFFFSDYEHCHVNFYLQELEFIQ